jgi:hypothetical protein
MFEFLVVVTLIYIAVKLDELAHWLKKIHEELQAIGEESDD